MNELSRLASTEAAQRRAADPLASVWVSANAGAGKTHVLINRVIRLLLAGTLPERILCLTFTKAAAAEMAARLYRDLGRWAVLPDEALSEKIEKLDGARITPERLKAARLLFARAIETPGGLKIQTIHAFCERLLHRFPLEAGVPPHFDILDDRAGAELMAQAQRQVLEEAGGDDLAGRGTPLVSALAVVARAGEFHFGQLFRAIISARGELARFLAAHGGTAGAASAIRARLGVGEDESEARLLRAASDLIPRDAIAGAVQVLATGSTNDQKKEKVLAAFLNESDAALALEIYKSAFLKSDGAPYKDLMTKKLREAHPEIEEMLRAEQDRLLGLDMRLRAMRLAEASEAMLHLGEALLARYEAIKRAHARLDYDDLIERARALLSERAMSAWVLYKLDGGLDHILVDEAQDTSPAQWEVIAALAEEFLSGKGAREAVRTIFAVGDEKQSIYSFQGAAPEKFSEMRKEFSRRVEAAGGVWSPVELLLSFRSVPQVLNAVDETFGDEAARAGLSAGGDPVLHKAFRENEAGLVEIWPVEEPEKGEDESPWDAPLDYPDMSSPRAKLANRIAETVAGWLREGERLHADGRRIRPGDIMILVRRRNAFVEEMVRALKTRGIPVAGADRMVLTEQIAVMDLIALGRFALMPEDDLTLAAVLKSPLLGLSEDDLYNLAYVRTGTLWSALSERADEARFAAAHAYLAQVLGSADRMRPYEFYAERLIREGGRRKLLARLGADVNDPVDEFLGLALRYEQDHAGSLEGFLHWVEEGRAEIKRDLDQGADEVRVMTVHGAKGLEAPIVFLPDTCAVPGAKFDPVLLFPGGAPLWPIRKANDEAEAAAAREHARALQMEEYKRLLYVAMTRAKDRLYVAGYKGKDKLRDECWHRLISRGLEASLQQVETPFGPVLRKEGSRAPEASGEDMYTEEIPLPSWVAAPAPAEETPPRPLAPSRFEGEAGEEPVALSPLAPGGAERFKRGRLIHRLLETLPGLEAGEREAAALRFLAHPAASLTEQEQAEIWQATKAVLETPDFAALFGPGSRAEVPVAGLVMTHRGGHAHLHPMSGQIDRLVETQSEVLIVDYKTNRPAPKRSEEVSPAYVAQLAAYRALLAHVYGQKTIRCALLWTDGPRLMEIPAEMLEKFTVS